MAGTSIAGFQCQGSVPVHSDGSDASTDTPDGALVAGTGQVNVPWQWKYTTCQWGTFDDASYPTTADFYAVDSDTPAFNINIPYSVQPLGVSLLGDPATVIIDNATATPLYTQDSGQLTMLGYIALVFVFIGFVGYIWNKMSAKKPWLQ